MSRKPDYVLKGMNKKTNVRTGELGAAWKNPNGFISVVLNPFVTLSAGEDWVFTLFPNDRETTPRKDFPYPLSDPGPEF